MKKVYSFYFLLLLIFLRVKLIYADKEEQDSGSDDSFYHRNNYTYFVSGSRRIDKMMAYVKHMVSIRSRRPQKYFGDNHFCAGTIIGSRTILTAAHCVMDKRKVITRPRRLLVVAGSPNRLRIENTTRQVAVAEVVPHQNYVRHNTDDIALIFLETDLPIYTSHIQKMPLPKTGPKYGTNCTVIGWGRMYHKGPLAATAAHIEVYLLPRDECQKFAPNYNFKGVLCAGDHVNYNEDPCRGDSGGPLICDGILTGIISWTIGCGHKVLPSLYTDIFSHIEWITRNEGERLSNTAFLTILIILMNIIHILKN